MTTRVLVDSNVLLDILTEAPRWFSWSADRLAECAENFPFALFATDHGVNRPTLRSLDAVFDYRMLYIRDNSLALCTSRT